VCCSSGASYLYCRALLHKPQSSRDNHSPRRSYAIAGTDTGTLSAPKLREAVEQSPTHMQLRDLSLKRAGHHPLAQTFEAVQLGLHQASSVEATPFLPDPPPQPFAGSQRCIAHCCSNLGLSSRFTVLLRGNHRLRASLGYRSMAAFSVIGTVGTHPG